jgi:dTDP-4-dehydrorhamnose reductase
VKTKILLLGSTGQVGWELNRTLLTLGDIVALDYPQIDLADPQSIRSILRETKPNLIVNATAYTDVDKAEREHELAMAINGTGPGILAEEAIKLGAALIHYSTDFVFDGTKGEPYTEEDIPQPLNVYGETKLAGERAIQEVGGAYLIFRTSWVYSLRRPCFVTKVLHWARQHETLRIVDDQISSPTWARSLAELTGQVLSQSQGEFIKYLKQNSGLYHLTGEGSCNRFEWAKAILELDPNKEQQIIKQLIPVKSHEFSTPALRPHNSTLSNKHFIDTFLLKNCSWQEALFLMFNQEG